MGDPVVTAGNVTRGGELGSVGRGALPCPVAAQVLVSGDEGRYLIGRMGSSEICSSFCDRGKTPAACRRPGLPVVDANETTSEVVPAGSENGCFAGISKQTPNRSFPEA